MYVRNSRLVRKKMEPRFTGPYKVLRRADGGNYILSNSRKQNLHRSYPLDQLKVIDDEFSDEIWQAACTTKRFPIDRIVDHRYHQDHLQYLVQWKGHDDDFNSWEPESALAFPDLVSQYWNSVPDTAAPTSV